MGLVPGDCDLMDDDSSASDGSAYQLVQDFLQNRENIAILAWSEQSEYSRSLCVSTLRR